MYKKSVFNKLGRQLLSGGLSLLLMLTLLGLISRFEPSEIKAEATPTAAAETETAATTTEVTPVVSAPALTIYPKPHNLEIKTGNLQVDNVDVIYAAQIDDVTRRRLEKALTAQGIVYNIVSAVNPANKTIAVCLQDDKSSALALYPTAGNNLAADKTDAYTLDINDNGITIVGSTVDSAFYAVTSLEQILEQQQKNLSCLSLADYADTRIRGFIEGYYGYPWSNENRMSLMEFGGRFKANVYIFAPKDDPYHAERWRDLYPQEDLVKLQEMARVGNENKCRFVWTIHPFMGKGSYKFNSNDVDGEIRAIIAKFEQLYGVGVRQFGVLGDDVGGLNREIVIKIINSIVDWGKQKGDVKDFVFCPASYNSAWAWNPGELNDYQRGFPENVHIFWTGSTTCAPVTADTVSTFKYSSNNGVERRDPLFWLNWPVNDVDMTRVFLGKGEMLHTNVTNLAGVVTNPMQEAQASKVAIFAIADYTWNISGFDADKSWKDSFSRIDKEASEALYTLAKHMSDAHPGGLRLGESEEIASLLNSVLNTVKSDSADIGEIDKLISEFDNIMVQADAFMAQSLNEGLKEELAPFVYALRDLCNSGKYYLQAAKLIKSEPDNKAAIWSACAQAILLNDQAKSYRHKKINVGTVEAKPAAKRLQPFVKEVADTINAKINNIFDFHPQAPVTDGQPQIITEPHFGVYLGDAKSKPEHIYDNNDDSFTWFDFGSGKNYADGNYIGLDLGSEKLIDKVHVVMGSTATATDYWTQYEVKISSDKQNWESISEVFTQSSQKAVQDITLATAKKARYVAIFNRAFCDKWVQIGAINVSTVDMSAVPAYTNMTASNLPKQVVTSKKAYLQLDTPQNLTLKPGEYIGLQLDNIQKIKSLSVEPQATSGLQVEGSINGKEWVAQPDLEKCKYLRLINKGNAEAGINLSKFEMTFDVIVTPFLESSNYNTIEGKNAGMDDDLTTPAWFKESQNAGKELVYNLGQTVNINNIKLYVKESENDFARHAVLEACLDDGNWTPLLAIGNQDGDNAGEDDGKIDELYSHLVVPNRYAEADGLNVTANKVRLRLTRSKSGSDKWLRFQEIVINDGTALLPPTNYDIEAQGDFRKHYFSDLSRDKNLLTYTASDKGGSLLYHLAASDSDIKNIEIFKSLGSYKAEIRTANGWELVNDNIEDQYLSIDCKAKDVYDLRLSWNDKFLVNEVRALTGEREEPTPEPTTEPTTAPTVEPTTEATTATEATTTETTAAPVTEPETTTTATSVEPSTTSATSTATTAAPTVVPAPTTVTPTVSAKPVTTVTIADPANTVQRAAFVTGVHKQAVMKTGELIVGNGIWLALLAGTALFLNKRKRR